MVTEEKWRTAVRAYEKQVSKIEALKQEVDAQIHTTRDLRWKVSSSLQIFQTRIVICGQNERALREGRVGFPASSRASPCNLAPAHCHAE